MICLHILTKKDETFIFDFWVPKEPCLIFKYPPVMGSFHQMLGSENWQQQLRCHHFHPSFQHFTWFLSICSLFRMCSFKDTPTVPTPKRLSGAISWSPTSSAKSRCKRPPRPARWMDRSMGLRRCWLVLLNFWWLKFGVTCVFELLVFVLDFGLFFFFFLR